MALEHRDDERDGEGGDERGANVVPFPTAPARRPAPAPTPLREVIGEVLRDERHAQERTLAEVAGDAAVSLPYLSEIERGRKEPSSEVLRSVCDALGIAVPDLLDESSRRLRQIEIRHIEPGDIEPGHLTSGTVGMRRSSRPGPGPQLLAA